MPVKLPIKVTAIPLVELTIPEDILTVPSVLMPVTFILATLRFVEPWPPSLSTPFAPIYRQPTMNMLLAVTPEGTDVPLKFKTPEE